MTPTIMRGLSTGLLGKKANTTPPTAGQPMDVAFLMPEASHTMTGQEQRQPASSSRHLVIKVLLAQLGLSMAVAMLFWGVNGYVSAYSALLGGLTCVLPNAFLALRLMVPRHDPGAGALVRAAYAGEIGKLALTVIMFIMVFTLVRPLAVGALFAGFVAGQFATFAGFLTRDGYEQEMGLKSDNNGE